MLYQITEHNSDASLINIIRENPLSIIIQNKYVDNIKEVFTKYANLLSGDRVISLFDTESIMDHIEKKWLYDGSQWVSYNKILNMKGSEITDLFTNYILHDTVPEWLEVCRYHTPDEMIEMYKDGEPHSDAQILDDLMFLSFDTISGVHARISPQRIDIFHARGGDLYNFDKGIDWNALILAVRKRHGLQKKENVGIEYAISEGIKTFIRGLSHKKEIQSEIIALASSSSSPKTLKSAVKKLLVAEDISLSSNGGGCGGCGEGYTLSYDHGFSGGFSIALYNIIHAYRGNKDFDMQSMWEDKEKFEEDKLWEAIYSQYAANLFSM